MFFVDEFVKSSAKLVGKTERPSPLLEMFVTILEKLLFVRSSPKFGGCHDGHDLSIFLRFMGKTALKILRISGKTPK